MSLGKYPPATVYKINSPTDFNNPESYRDINKIGYFSCPYKMLGYF
jgi:hypothetical protein